MPQSPGAPLRVSPLSRRLWLGDQLRELRQEQRKVIKDVADLVGIDRTLLTRIETGQRRVHPDQIMKIVERLGIDQYAERWQEFYALARDADSPGWWEARSFKGMGPRQILPADLEAGASRIRWYDFAMVPGLLQSPAYIEARHSQLIYAAPDTTAAVRGRRRRQQEVFEPGGPQIEAIVEEMVIRRLMVPREAMVEQLHHLLDLIDNQPQVSLRVLPVGGELVGLRAPRSPWTLYTFATGDPSLAVVEALTDDILLRDQAAVAWHEELWAGLNELALSVEQTRSMIAEAAADLARG